MKEQVHTGINAEQDTVELYINLIHSLPIGVGCVGMDGYFKAINPACEQLLGYSSEEVVGKMQPNSLHVQEEIDQRALELTQQLGYPVTGLFSILETTLKYPDKAYHEWTVIHKSGRRFPARISFAPLHNKLNDLIGFIGVIEDLTYRKKIETELGVSNRLQQAIFDSAGNMIIATDLEGKVVLFNQCAETMLGYKADEVRHRLTPEVWHKKSEMLLYSEQLSQLLGRYVEPGFDAFIEHINLKGQEPKKWTFVAKDGSCFPGLLSVSKLSNDNNEITGYLGVVSNITELEKTQQELQFLARYDQLTKLPNRSCFLEKLPLAIERARLQKIHVAVIFVDLDNFKHVNDALGHNIGDKLIIAVGQILRELSCGNDYVARLGGDEFGIMLEHSSVESNLDDVAVKYLSGFSHALTIEGYEIQTSPSLGIAIYPQHGETPEMLLKHADAAMYHAKTSTNINYFIFDNVLDAKIKKRYAIECALTKAVVRKQFILEYQPQVSLINGKMVGVEALLRWYSEELGKVEPSEFVAIAEEMGLIIEVGDWIIDQAFKDLAVLLSMNVGGDFVMSINLSCVQLTDGNFESKLIHMLNKNHINPKNLMFELTETALLKNPNKSAKLIDRIVQHGIKIVLDDFGVGFSSLQQIQYLTVSALKIDATFLKDVTTNKNNSAIVITIITLAKELGIDVIAEGVENKEQADFLLQHGCTKAQGFYFSKPIRVQAFMEQHSLFA